MTDVVSDIKELFTSFRGKIEKIKPVQSVNDDSIANFEKLSVISYQKAVQDALTNDLVRVFGDENKSILEHLLNSSELDPKKSGKQRTGRKQGKPAGEFICDHPGCELAFVNAGNLRNHQYAHEREVMNGTLIPGSDNSRPRKYKTKGSGVIVLSNVSSALEEEEQEAQEILDISVISATLAARKKSIGGAPTRKAYSLEFKMEVLKCYDEMCKLDDLKDVQFAVGTKYGVTQGLVSKWLKHRHDIEHSLRDTSLKRVKNSKVQNMINASNNIPSNMNSALQITLNNNNGDHRQIFDPMNHMPISLPHQNMQLQQQQMAQQQFVQNAMNNIMNNNNNISMNPQFNQQNVNYIQQQQNITNNANQDIQFPKKKGKYQHQIPNLQQVYVNNPNNNNHNQQQQTLLVEEDQSELFLMGTDDSESEGDEEEE